MSSDGGGLAIFRDLPTGSVQLKIGTAQGRCEQELGQGAFARRLALPFLG